MAATVQPPAHEVSELVIEAGRAESQYWRDLWRYRELFYFLAWRDILVRYKQTAIGVAWALIRPLLTMLVFTVIYSRVAKLPSGGIPYALLVFSALLPWQFFATSLAEASNSLIGNANLISKVYFPRLIVPASAVITSLVDFAISFVILLGLFAWYRFAPGWQFLTLPLWTVWAFLAALGPGLYITALNVKYRDFRYVIPFIVQFGLYVSPVGFSSEVLCSQLHLPRAVYSLNPIVGVIDGFRWAIGSHAMPAYWSALGADVAVSLNPGLQGVAVGLRAALGSEVLYWPGLLVSAVVTGFFLWLGVWYFRRMERTFADVI